MTTFKRMQKLAGLKEAEDEFTVTAPPEWNVEYLTPEKTIDPDMWDKPEVKKWIEYFVSTISYDDESYQEYLDRETKQFNKLMSKAHKIKDIVYNRDYNLHKIIFDDPTVDFVTAEMINRFSLLGDNIKIETGPVE